MEWGSQMTLTSKQMIRIMNQIALHYTPLIFFGVAIGGVGGYFGLNPMIAALTKGMGVIKPNSLHHGTGQF